MPKEIGDGIGAYTAFTRQDLFKKWFLSEVSWSDLAEPVLLSHQEIIFPFDPHKIDTRRGMQQGLFLASGSPRRTFEETLVDILQEIESHIGDSGGREPSVFKIVIPGNLRRPLMRHLEKMNITAASLFDGIEGLAKFLREKIAIMDRHDWLGDQMGLPT